MFQDSVIRYTNIPGISHAINRRSQKYSYFRILFWLIAFLIGSYLTFLNIVLMVNKYHSKPYSTESYIDRQKTISIGVDLRSSQIFLLQFIPLHRRLCQEWNCRIWQKLPKIVRYCFQFRMFVYS